MRSELMWLAKESTGRLFGTFTFHKNWTTISISRWMCSTA